MFQVNPPVLPPALVDGLPQRCERLFLVATQRVYPDVGNSVTLTPQSRRRYGV